jgi:hypothetical protein
MDWEGCRRKVAIANLMQYLDIYMHQLRKTKKNSSEKELYLDVMTEN